jgi:peptidoglycan/LPS O-acetylase OafA/YrhL
MAIVYQNSVRQRWTSLAYHAPTTLFWIALTGLYALVAHWGVTRHHPVITGLVITALFLATALCCFVAVMGAEDAWSGFRRQKRLAALCGLLLVVTLIAGLTLGF